MARPRTGALALSITILVSGAMAMHAANAAVANGPGAIEWRCQLPNKALEIVCVPHAPASIAATSLPSLPMPSNDLQAVAFRGADEIFSTEAWIVPLYGPPESRRHVIELLESVLCDAAPKCKVTYDGGI